MPEYLLAAEGLRYRYDDGTDALRGIDFGVAAGEKVGLVGPNGSGKTTLLLCLGGLFKYQGTVKLEGRPLTRSGFKESRGRIGLIFQSPDDQLFMPTLEEDLAFGPINLGLGDHAAHHRVHEVADRMGLDAMLGRAPHHLSMGQKRNAAIAAVLAMEPAVLLMDEPSSNLDPAFAAAADRRAGEARHGHADRLARSGPRGRAMPTSHGHRRRPDRGRRADRSDPRQRRTHGEARPGAVATHRCLTEARTPATMPSHMVSLRRRLCCLAALPLLTVAACNVDSPVPAAGAAATPAEAMAAQGAMAYLKFCAGCHGEKGDGRGRAAPFFDPSPCDFTQAAFRFSSRGKTELPTDDDLRRTLRNGLKRSAMPAFALLDEPSVEALIQHVKKHSPKWSGSDRVKPIPVVDNPYASDSGRAAGIQRGKVVFHKLAKCWLCHPSYMTADELKSTLASGGEAAPPLRSNLAESVRKPKDHGGYVYPPDFLRDLPRSGSTPEDLYRSIAGGIGSTPMPQWYDALGAGEPANNELRTEKADLWALACYVHSLTERRPAMLTPGRFTVRERPRVINLHPPVEATDEQEPE